MADASHELRSPLTVIRSHMQLLLHLPEHTIKEEALHISTVLKETKRMKKKLKQNLHNNYFTIFS
ncbi:hypothetical protein I6N90_01220 [Paenibacillus sp. GSMTC-2017]|uniref:histidine kinase dimerization/phospho-acceptor domain-containing protein n=1 Tax=Paenibacillus sp. GSMTC-2017 TaxID=2794350 RepID=UPI0018D7F85E|nr:hypothetical protein [Paenibacillus sp. GSMTC-2017]